MSPAIPAIGTRVRFTRDNLGASRRDQLWACVGRPFGTADEGVVAFPHPNPNLADDAWFYVEVRGDAGEPLFVGVTPALVRVVGVDVGLP